MRMKIRLAVGALVGATVLGTAAFVQGTQQSDPEAAETSAASSSSASSEQPIAFVHDVHAGEEEGQYGMDCQYCHFSAERSVDAGIPPVETCMGCHRIILGSTETAQAEIAKIAEHYNAGRAIEWVRIYKASDHVHFPHLRHVQAGVDCTECHGQVQEMGVLTEVAPEAEDLSMGWCVTCHREHETQPRTECSVCHY